MSNTEALNWYEEDASLDGSECSGAVNKKLCELTGFIGPGGDLYTIVCYMWLGSPIFLASKLRI